MDDFVIAEKVFTSRLLVGTGKFSDNAVMTDSLQAAQTQIVTLALRRVDLAAKNQDDMLAALDTTWLLPNTSGARTAAEAVRLAQLARASGLSNWVKLEVIPDAKYLLPDAHETYVAAKQLVQDGFVVLPYIQADPVLAKALEQIGCATVMPLAAPIGSNQGVQTESMLQIIIDQATVPVIVDAGLGKPSHAAHVMELGADAVLVNTAIATAPNPVSTAKAFNLAVQAGRLAYTTGMPATYTTAHPSSPPLTAFLDA